MAQQLLYKVCPVCDQGAVGQQPGETRYRCDNCGLTLVERSLLKFFKKGRLGVERLPEGNYSLVWPGLQKIALPSDRLKIILGNVYTDEQLAALAAGALDVLRPVRTVLAEIILEQLKEECFLQVTELRRGHGHPLSEGSSYLPHQPVPRQGMDWQDSGNLFCTTNRLVFPSDRFTFIRLDRKLVAVQAFSDGLAVQRKDEAYATYFVGCYPHEAALVTSYVMAKVPLLREKQPTQV